MIQEAAPALTVFAISLEEQMSNSPCIYISLQTTPLLTMRTEQRSATSQLQRLLPWNLSPIMEEELRPTRCQ